MTRPGDLIVGLDMGTTKTCCVVGEVRDEGVGLLGIGSHPSKGLREGVVIHVEATVAAIQKAVEDAEMMAGCRVSRVYAGIAGGHIKSFDSHGVVGIRDKEITRRDVQRAIEAARAVPLPPDREVIHVITQEFVVDEQDGIKEPVGMSGVRLEAKIHLVTAATTMAQNLIKCANRTGLEVAEIVLEQLASAEAVATAEEREIGVAVVDIGGGTTDLILFHEGTVRHTAVVPLGGQHVTQDLSIGLSTPVPEAERLKKKYGCAFARLVQPSETVEVPGVGERRPRILARRIPAEIIEARMEEVWMLVEREIILSGFEHLLAAGVVVTGGGAMLPGVIELGEKVLGMPVRLGVPAGIAGLADPSLAPQYATGVGLVLYGRRTEHVGAAGPSESRIAGWAHRVRDFLGELF